MRRNLVSARLFVFWAACLLATPASAKELANLYLAEIVRILDGDTIEVRLHLWMSLVLTTRVRLRGIDAPELNGACLEERRRAIAARDYLAALLKSGTVWVTRITHGKYAGRVVATVELLNRENVAALLVAAGHARKTRAKRVRWCPP